MTLLLPLLENQPWRLAAACREYDPNIWFPDTHDKKAMTHAKAICKSCPVRKQCLKYALEAPINHGIWGGESERARQRMRGIRV